MYQSTDENTVSRSLQEPNPVFFLKAAIQYLQALSITELPLTMRNDSVYNQHMMSQDTRSKTLRKQPVTKTDLQQQFQIS